MEIMRFLLNNSMLKSFSIIIINFLILGSFQYCSAQTIDKNKFSAIISLNESYKMDVSTTYLNSYGEVYLITSDQPIDSTLLALSKNEYVSQKGIFDALKTKFNVYVTLKEKGGADLYDELVPTTNYSKSYSFKLDDSPKPPQAITNFVMWQRSAAGFRFSKVDKKCNPKTSLYCTVIIKKIS
jgi:hypothetical protein